MIITDDYACKISKAGENEAINGFVFVFL